MPVRFTRFLNVAIYEIKYSQGGVATYARCNELLNNLFTANLLENFPVK